MAAQLDHKLTSKQHKALAALLSEATIAAAAQKTGVTAGTLHTWLNEPAFADAYRAARREAVGQAIARLQQFSTIAVTVQASIIAEKGSPPAVRVAAASKILDMAIKAVELEDIEARLAALEAAQAQPGG